MTAATAQQMREAIQEQRYEAYQQWERDQLSNPRFAGVRMLVDDLQNLGQITGETWDRFEVEDVTWAAEVLNAPHSHVDRFRFDGRDVIVKEADGVNPAVTLRQVYERGLAKTRQDVLAEPGLAFQLRRDELFLDFYEEIERMLRGETDHDTIHMVSTCPRPEEISDDPDEAARLLAMKFYNPARGKSFDYTARLLPDGRLELSATTLDSSNLVAHAKVLQASGFENVSFALLQSHEYGRFLSYDNTTDKPLEVVVARRVGIYDQELQRQTGRKHRYGREDDTIDAHEFFRDHCGDYWAGYKAYHELLARHLAGEELQKPLQRYLLKVLDLQEREGMSVLDQSSIDRLRAQLRHGKVTMDMAMSCRDLLVYDHHATLTSLMKEFKETGTVPQLQYKDGQDFMDAYADTASSNGSEAAARGETFDGCETATGVNSLSAAAQAAANGDITLEQALRVQEAEALHCLRIQLYGYTIRKGVTCPFCSEKVDARDTQASIECLSAECGAILDKETGEVSYRPKKEQQSDQSEKPEKEQPPVRLRSGQTYEIAGVAYRRELMTVIGGAKITYIDPNGQRIIGMAAEQIEATIFAQLSAETQAA